MTKLEEIKAQCDRAAELRPMADMFRNHCRELLRRLEIADKALYAIRNADRGCFSQLDAALEAIRK